MTAIVDQAQKVIESDNVVKRLQGLFDALMQESKIIPAMLQPTVNQLVHNFLKDADPAKVAEYIEQVRDQVIPWILNGDSTSDPNNQ